MVVGKRVWGCPGAETQAKAGFLFSVIDRSHILSRAAPQGPQTGRLFGYLPTPGSLAPGESAVRLQTGYTDRWEWRVRRR
ncbi:hypothetical protein AGOR_G00231860 [Albula goreensis]|uniref:Uncharacterized protein n=1 Tax=Albula goreensis TaxID=1534307 RepID=A0A8T3CLM0_9TELE|nr:hypothetical protein AGOR_G00231860 [Albula goreensis]